MLKNLVDVHWLKSKIDAKDLIILDSRSQLGSQDYGIEEYNKGHIPNAIFVSVEDILTGSVQKHGGRHPLPDMNAFVKDMERMGVDDSSVVVVYDDGDLAMGGRLWWMLKYIGKKEVYLLAGGIDAWKKAGFEVDTINRSPKEKGSLTIEINESIITTIDEVKTYQYMEDAIIVDSRTEDRYRGEIEPIDRVPGHIPNSKNYPWTILTQDNMVRDVEFLKDHFKGLEKYEKIIVHCGSGITGTVNFIFMEEVGLKPILYVGGYSDWISYDENEIVKEV